MLNHKSILITGGTGSFGKAFTHYVLKHYKPRKVIVFSRDELKQYQMQQMLPADRYPAMRYFLGDVRDFERLKQAMRGVDYVVHAAALKQVPAAEYNPFECIKTNVNGAENVINAAIYSGVKRIVALSTDKAVNPINLYGATKLASDKLFVAANNMSGAKGARFSVVRYGNVIGSRGSVIPFFLKCAAEKRKTVPITDVRMTRFWISLEQGVKFVMKSLQDMQGGEVFIPKIPSMKISDLAYALCPGLKHEIVGIRPGEKLHESLLSAEDGADTYEQPERYVVYSKVVSTIKKRHGKSVGSAFDGYRSDNNPLSITGTQLKQMLKKESIEY